MPLNKVALPILAMARIAKRLVVLAVDASLCVFTVWLAFFLHLGKFVALSGAAMWAAIASVVIALRIFVVSGLLSCHLLLFGLAGADYGGQGDSNLRFDFCGGVYSNRDQ